MGPFPREDMMAGLDAMAVDPAAAAPMPGAPPGAPAPGAPPGTVLCGVCNTVIDAVSGEPVVAPQENPMMADAGAAAPPPMPPPMM